MTRPQKDSEAGKSGGSSSSASKERLEMAQQIAREMARDDHHAFQVSVRNSRD
jgi:hypothetical protein